MKVRLEFPELYLMIEALAEKIVREENIVANSSPEEDEFHDSEDNIRICTFLIEKLKNKQRKLSIHSQKVAERFQELRRNNITDFETISKVWHLKKTEND